MIGAGLRTTVGRNGRRKARIEAASRAAQAAPNSNATTRARESLGVALRAAGWARRTMVRRLAGGACGLGSRSLPRLAGVVSTSRLTLRTGTTALEATTRLGTGVRGSSARRRRSGALILARDRPRGTELRTGARTGRGLATGCGRLEMIGAGAEDGMLAGG